MTTLTEINSLQTKIFEAAARKSPKIISLFHYFYYLLIIFLGIGVYANLKSNSLQPFFYDSGIKFGRLALITLGIVVLPGILGRFRLEIKITRIVTLFRRQLGICVFLFAFIHYNLIRGVPRIAGILPFKLPFPLFETIGLVALTFLFLMFLTSNNLSVRKLGRSWKRLHRIVYVILWLVVLHTGLQRISIWTFLIGAFASLEVISLLYSFLRVKLAKG